LFLFIPLLPSLARSVFLFMKARKLYRETGSPMAHSYYVNFKICTMFDIAVLIAMTSGWLLVRFHQGNIAALADPSFSLLISFYMLYTGVNLTVGNFKVLIDLPLKEEEQLKIMGVLAKEFMSYENIGNIYTRQSGRTRFIDIELYMDEKMTLRKISTVRKRLDRSMKKEFDDVKFNLIPLRYVAVKKGR